MWTIKIFECCLYGTESFFEKDAEANISTYKRGSSRSIKIIIHRVSQEERTKLREGVPYVKLYRHNPKHLYPKLNGYGDNGKRSLKL